VIIPGYIFLGFAIGALFLGAGLLAGITGLSLPVMLVAFAVLSLIAYLAMRKIFGLRTGSVSRVRRLPDRAANHDMIDAIRNRLRWCCNTLLIAKIGTCWAHARGDDQAIF